MRAVDTNIHARFHLRDDAAQGRIAAAVLAAGDLFVPKTVILELELVLRYVADQPEGKVIECLEHLIALLGITIEDRDEIEAALTHCRKGIDFAVALHPSANLSSGTRGRAERRSVEIGRGLDCAANTRCLRVRSVLLRPLQHDGVVHSLVYVDHAR